MSTTPTIQILGSLGAKVDKTFKNEGEAADAKATGDRLNALENQPTATTLPADGIAQVGVMYFLGEITSLTGGFPSTAKMGDMVYISFYTGTTIPAVSLTTNNHIGLALDLSTNKCYEIIGLWNGAVWVFATQEVDR